MKGSRLTVYAAIAGNAIVALTKFIAAAASGSSAMFSEGMHSVVDTGDGLLILLGMWLSRRPPSASHPYGHGAQVYFWSLVVAMSIFGMGGVVSIYEGVHHLISPSLPHHVTVGLAVLGVSFVIEGISWVISLRGFRRSRGRRGLWEGIVKSKDPTTFTVVLEDSAALLGILAAAAGIALAVALREPAYDAIGSIIVGTLLVTVGAILGRETWSLLLGESASGSTVQSIEAIAREHPAVLDVRRTLTMHLGPEHVHVDLDLHLDPTAPVIDVCHEIEDAIRAKHQTIHHVFVHFGRD
jgi:cation diffusion facilitator family transporter